MAEPAVLFSSTLLSSALQRALHGQTVLHSVAGTLVIIRLRHMESMTYRNVALPDHLVRHLNDAAGPCTHHFVPPGAVGASAVLSISRSMVDATYQCMGRGVLSRPSMPLLLQKWLLMHAGHVSPCLMVINHRWLHPAGRTGSVQTLP